MRIEAALAENGRRIEDDHYGVTLPLRIGVEGDPSVIAARKRLSGHLLEKDHDRLDDGYAIGSPEAVVALLRLYIAQGIAKFVMLPIADDAADLIAQTQLLVRHVLSAIEDRT